MIQSRAGSIWRACTIASIAALLPLAPSGLRAATHATHARPARPAVKFGVFARSDGKPPYGMFEAKGRLDPRKLDDILAIGATWTRSPLSTFFTDRTVFGAGRYDWASADILGAWLTAHHIEDVVGIEPGPVQINTPGRFDPHETPIYPTPEAFATYCSAVASHFGPLTRAFSEPGNEVNSDTTKFPNGAASVAPYARACYRAIHTADPRAFVWGLELNADRAARPIAFVSELKALGCGIGTCYDGLSLHLSLRIPTPPPGTPCFPAPGGDYSAACVADVQRASGNARLPMMIGETVVTTPGMVPDAEAKARAAPAMLEALAAIPGVRYINYANLDECALYPSGYFMNGCLVDADGERVPGWQRVRAVFQQRRHQSR